jgi:hypothetical protein
MPNIINKQQLQLGDVLVQYKGQPWVWGAQILIGHPYPHARCVSRVDEKGVWVIEDGKQFLWSNAGVHEYIMPKDLNSFEVWRPNTDDLTKQAAVQWMQSHKGQMYDYGRMAELAMLSRVHLLPPQPGMDNDTSYDNRSMICSELIAMGYYRGGQKTGSNYDPCPHVTDRSAGPWDLRNPNTLSFLGFGTD